MTPSVFPLWHIALTGLIALVVSAAGLFLQYRHAKNLSPRETFMVALVVGLSVVFWRTAANAPQLNDDPLPPFSPNDLLCPVFTFVCLSLYAAFRRPSDLTRWEKTRAWLTLLSFAVNVLVI